MHVYIEKDNEHKEVVFSGSVDDLLKSLKINPETVLVVKNGEVVTEKEELKDVDKIKILSVVSGG